MDVVRVEHQTEWVRIGEFYRCTVKWPDGSKCGTVHTANGFGPFGGTCMKAFDREHLPPGEYTVKNVITTSLLPLITWEQLQAMLIPGTNLTPLLRFPGWEPIGAGARVYDDGRDPFWTDDHRSRFVD